MPVFVITTPDGQRFKLIASNESSAKQTAATRTNIPAVRLDIRNALDLGIAGSGASDETIFSRLEIPALDRGVAEAADERLTTSRGFRVEPQRQQLIDARSARIRDLERERTGELRPRSVPIDVTETPMDTGGRSESFIDAALRGGGSIQAEPSGIDVSVPDRTVRQVGETQIRPSVSQNKIWLYTRPDGSTVQVVAQTEQDAYNMLVRRGDFGPNDRPPLSNLGAAPPNTPIGLFSDNAGVLSREAAANQATDTGATGGTGGQTLPTGEVQADLADREEVFPEASFRAFLRGAGVEPGGIGGRVLSNQFGPSLNTFALLNDLATKGIIPQSPGSTFTEFLGSGSLGGQRRANLLRGALGNVRELPSDFEVFGPQGTFTDKAAQLANAFLQAQGGSPISTRIFSPTLSGLQQRAQDMGFAGQQQNFLDFLRQQVPVR